MNILITNVSKLSLKDGKINYSDYIDEEENKISSCCMTNEAPIKSLLKRLSDRNEKLDKIIYIESETVRNVLSENIQSQLEDIKGSVTHSELLRELIKIYASDNNFQFPSYSEQDTVSLQDEPTDEDVSKAMIQVYDIINSYVESQKEINLFIEANGGVRYVLTMLLSITKIFEKRNEKVQIKEILSMVYNQKPTQIQNTKKIYDTSQLVGIIDEYINYGKISSMKKYVEDLFQDSNKVIQDDVMSILSDLSKIAEDIQLCRTSMMLEDFYKNGGIINTVNEFINKYHESNESSLIIFIYILRQISLEYKQLFPENYNQEENFYIYLPKVIKWCLEKDFIQQALTLCAERIPEYLFESGKINICSYFKDLLEKRNDKEKEYEDSYFFIAHLQDRFFCDIYEAKANAFLKKFKQNNNSIFSSTDCHNTFYNIGLSYKGIVPDYENLQKRILSFIRDYKKMEVSEIKKLNNIQQLFQNNNFSKDLLDKKIPISNKLKNTIFLTLNGEYKKEDGSMAEHDNIKTKNQRLCKVIPTIVLDEVQPINLVSKYEFLMESVLTTYPQDKKNAIIQKYAQKQSRKFYILDALQGGYITSNMVPDDLQNLLYLYSICKEQRNLSNHAHISESEKDVVLNSEQIVFLIKLLLQKCEL